MKQPIIFCDFDGTITEKDNIISLMEQFAPPEFEEIKEDILSQKISIREGVGKMFALLPSSLKKEITDYAIKNAKIRPGFQEFVSYTRNRGIPLYIVSGGIDFFIHPVLEKFGPFAGLYCNGSDFSGENIEITWPNSCDSQCKNDCGCCKPSIMRRNTDTNSFKIVIGDSVTDLEAAKQADLVLARAYLKEKSQELNLPYQPFETFYDVLSVFENMEEVIK